MSQDDSDLLGALPGFGRTINQFKDLIARDVKIALRVGMPAHVVSWSAPISAGVKSKPALVRVQPHFYAVVRMNSPSELTAALQAEGWEALQENDGWVRRRALPEIPNCPVAYTGPAGMLPRGPLRKGEVGWLMFADRSLDKWTQTGGPVDPVYQDFHILNDAVFIPGLRYGTVAKAIDSDKFACGPEDGSAGLFVDAVTAPAKPNIEVKTEGATATIDAATNINLGANATRGVARLNDTVDPGAAFNAFAAATIAALNALSIGAGVPITPPVAPATLGTIATASTKSRSE